MGHLRSQEQLFCLRNREGKHAEAQATQEKNLIEHVCKPKKQRLDAIGMACANQEDPALQKPTLQSVRNRDTPFPHERKCSENRLIQVAVGSAVN